MAHRATIPGCCSRCWFIRISTTLQQPQDRRGRYPEHPLHVAGRDEPSGPQHKINRFREKWLQGYLKPIFTQVVLLLCEESLLSVKELYTDGTKIETNANRYTFVWGKAIKHNKDQLYP